MESPGETKGLVIKVKDITLGFAITGSFCTFDKALAVMEYFLKAGYNIVPIMSQNAYTTDTRFGTAEHFGRRITELTGRAIIHDISSAEPIGPERLLDAMLILPCTGNTLGKLAGGITDTSVTMAAKAHIRNARPLILGVSTNDALGTSAKNIGQLMNQKHVYLVPMRQDDHINKPNSIVADFESAGQAVESALAGIQCQPLYV